MNRWNCFHVPHQGGEVVSSVRDENKELSEKIVKMKRSRRGRGNQSIVSPRRTNPSPRGMTISGRPPLRRLQGNCTGCVPVRTVSNVKGMSGQKKYFR